MDLKWDYAAKNNGTTEAVATLYKANGCPVLQVYKGKDSYFSRPCGEYACHVDKVKITYETVDHFTNRQCSGVPNDKKKEIKLKYACDLIKQDFDSQADTISRLFS